MRICAPRPKVGGGGGVTDCARWWPDTPRPRKAKRRDRPDFIEGIEMRELDARLSRMNETSWPSERCARHQPKFREQRGQGATHSGPARRGAALCVRLPMFGRYRRDSWTVDRCSKRSVRSRSSPSSAGAGRSGSFRSVVGRRGIDQEISVDRKKESGASRVSSISAALPRRQSDEEQPVLSNWR